MSADGPFDISIDFGQVGADEVIADRKGDPQQQPPSPSGPRLAVRVIERARRPHAPAVALDARRLLVAAGLVIREQVQVSLTTTNGVWVAVTPEGPVTIGRRADQAQLVVADTTVSRRHCRVQVDDSGVVTAEDLGSANGTWIHRHDHRITLEAGRPTLLEDGDWLRSGDLAVAHVTITRDGR